MAIRIEKRGRSLPGPVRTPSQFFNQLAGAIADLLADGPAGVIPPDVAAAAGELRRGLALAGVALADAAKVAVAHDSEEINCLFARLPLAFGQLSEAVRQWHGRRRRGMAGERGQNKG